MNVLNSAFLIVLNTTTVLEKLLKYSFQAHFFLKWLATNVNMMFDICSKWAVTSNYWKDAAKEALEGYSLQKMQSF